MLVCCDFYLFVFYVLDFIYRDVSYYWLLDEINIIIKNVQVFKKERKEVNSVLLLFSFDEYWEVQVNKGVRDLKIKQ